MLNYKNLLAPQAYLRITTIGIDDVDGYVICVILVILSLGSLLAARKYLSTIIRSLHGLLEIQTAEGFRIQAAPQGGASTADAKTVLLTIRPEAIDLTDTAAEPPAKNQITGRVVASAYQGSLVEYEIESSGRIIRVNVINPKGKRLSQRGDEATIAFAAEDVGIISE